MVEAEAPTASKSKIDNRTCVSDEAELFVEYNLRPSNLIGNSFSEPQLSDTPHIAEAKDTRGNHTLSCPQCGNKNVIKDGQRYLYDGTAVQRWLCKNKTCFYRFSEKDPNSSNGSQRNPAVHTQSLKSSSALLEKRQVCDILQESKNLAEQTRLENAQREGTNENISTLLLDYAWKAKKQGLAEITIRQQTYRLKLLAKRGAILTNGDSVSTILALSNWTGANKKNYIKAYKSFTKMFHIQWEPPQVRVQEKLPFIPTEAEIDQLIAGCGTKTATFLQVLKDTGARSCEASKIKWIDVDENFSAITINNPAKGSLPRRIKIAPKTMAMIKAMPKTGDYLFNTNCNTHRTGFTKQRNRLARTLQNPRLKEIHFHTLRHWKATMEYHRTKDILHVKHLLGHKQLKNTEIYTHLITFESDDWHVSYAKNLDEETKLIEAGFEYVRYSNKDEVAIYRKRI